MSLGAGTEVQSGANDCDIGWSFGVHMVGAYEVEELGLTFIFPCK